MAEEAMVILSSDEEGPDVGLGYVPVRAGRRLFLLLDSEGYRCKRAALLGISNDVRAGRLFRGEDRGMAIARIRSEYEALGWVRTSLLWPGTRRLRRAPARVVEKICLSMAF